MPFGGIDGKLCVVLGCKNTGRGRRAWNQTRCGLHGLRLKRSCGCRPPFELHPFPDAPELRKIWLLRIGLPELEITDATYVCSIHFVEGKPTQRSAFPTLNLSSLEEDDELSEDEKDEGEVASKTIGNSENPLKSEGESSDVKEVGESDDGKSEYVTGDPNKAGEFAPDPTHHCYDGYQSDERMEMVETKVDEVEVNTEYSDTMEEEEEGGKIIPGQEQEGEKGSKNEDKDKSSDDDEVEMLCAMRPLALYYPQAQVVQISNPVKYIQECHARISQLVDEKEEQKKEFEQQVDKLTNEVKSLKRRLVEANKAGRMSLAAADSTRFRVVPKQGSNKVVVIRKGLEK